jgi:hypothetical protein
MPNHWYICSYRFKLNANFLMFVSNQLDTNKILEFDAYYSSCYLSPWGPTILLARTSLIPFGLLPRKELPWKKSSIWFSTRTESCPPLVVVVATQNL